MPRGPRDTLQKKIIYFFFRIAGSLKKVRFRSSTPWKLQKIGFFRSCHFPKLQTHEIQVASFAETPWQKLLDRGPKEPFCPQTYDAPMTQWGFYLWRAAASQFRASRASRSLWKEQACKQAYLRELAFSLTLGTQHVSATQAAWLRSYKTARDQIWPASNQKMAFFRTLQPTSWQHNGSPGHRRVPPGTTWHKLFKELDE